MFTTNPSSGKHKFLLGLNIDEFEDKVKNYDPIEEVEESEKSVESVESSDTDERLRNAH